MKYSIIIPAYHAQNTILACLESIGSDLEDTEVIIVSDERDDEKDNKTRKLVETYMQERQLTEHIRYVRNEKEHGVSGARNTGLERARGAYVWFVDSDDIVCTTWKEAWDKATISTVDVIVAGYENWEDNVKKESKQCVGFHCVLKRHEFVKEYLQKLKEEWFINAVWNKLFRREFLMQNRIVFPQNGSMGEDLCFCLSAISRALEISLSDEIVYRYIQYTNINSLCAGFHLDAIDMTCFAWDLERKLYESEQLELPDNEIKEYRAAVESYQQDLILHANGSWKQFNDSEGKSVAAGIKKKKATTQVWTLYCRYKVQRLKRIVRSMIRNE